MAEDINRGMCSRGHEVTVLTSRMKGLPGDLKEGNLRVMRVSCLRRQPFRATFLSMAAYLLVGLVPALRLLHTWRPDLIHVHFAVPAGALAWMLQRLTNIPYVLTTHLGDVPGGVPEKTSHWFRLVYPFTHRIWREARQVVAVSAFTRQLALVHYTVSIRVILNGVDLHNIKPSRKKVDQIPRIIFAGRFIEQKNPVQIVRSLAELDGLAWQCVMVGDGPLLEKVEQEINARGLKERFTLTGWIPPQEVLAWFDRSDILFMPSLSEGLPVVGVQALAKGLAIVVSRIGGFLDIVDDQENGFLVDSTDPTGFSSALRKLLVSRNALQKCQRASLAKAKQFDINRVVAQYESIFKDVAHG